MSCELWLYCLLRFIEPVEYPESLHRPVPMCSPLHRYIPPQLSAYRISARCPNLCVDTRVNKVCATACRPHLLTRSATPRTPRSAAPASLVRTALPLWLLESACQLSDSPRLIFSRRASFLECARPRTAAAGCPTKLELLEEHGRNRKLISVNLQVASQLSRSAALLVQNHLVDQLLPFPSVTPSHERHDA